MRKLCLIICLIYIPVHLFGQGYNHQWLLGNYYFIQDPKGRMFIDSNNYSIIPENRKMPFLGTQGNICDANGNFLMSSNGVWIANANNDTMMNGSGLNPGPYVDNWSFGTPNVANNVFVPDPVDSNKYLLFHHTATEFNPSFLPALELFYSEIDITLDGGLGGVTSKNNIVMQDTLGWGIGVCRHANGKSWWVAMMKDSSSFIKTILYDSTNSYLINTQDLGYSPKPHANVAQLTFSLDGTKFISSTYDNFIDRNSYLVISDFDRCSGIFSNTQSIQLSNGSYLWGLAFSPSGEFAYACTETEIFQVNTTTLAVDTVAVYDGFISPPNSPCCPSTFFNMYLAANGKIYVTSGSSVRHFTEINYPDNAGAACDVQQHAVAIGNYAHLAAVPNHPNYELGCDTTLGCPCLITGIEEANGHDFKFSVSPNPTKGLLKMMYLLPQNHDGELEVIDMTGRIVYQLLLPPWSTIQTPDLSFLPGGVYNVAIVSGNSRASARIVVIND